MAETPINLLIIFTRNPELGKCKTRLAATVGDRSALEIYKILLQHTMGITSPLPVDKIVYYSENILHDDLWDSGLYRKALQEGRNLGERMFNAFKAAFQEGFQNVILIGSDVYDLNTADLKFAFEQLKLNDTVLGPADDGGYYLIGMRKLIPEVFQSKAWGTDTVLEDTMGDLSAYSTALLPMRKDIDRYEDIKNIPAFRSFLIDLAP